MLREALRQTRLITSGLIWQWLRVIKGKKTQNNQCLLPSSLLLVFLHPGSQIVSPEINSFACRITICCGDATDDSGRRELKWSCDIAGVDARRIIRPLQIDAGASLFILLTSVSRLWRPRAEVCLSDTCWLKTNYHFLHATQTAVTSDL